MNVTFFGREIREGMRVEIENDSGIRFFAEVSQVWPKAFGAIAETGDHGPLIFHQTRTTVRRAEGDVTYELRRVL